MEVTFGGLSEARRYNVQPPAAAGVFRMPVSIFKKSYLGFPDRVGKAGSFKVDSGAAIKECEDTKPLGLICGSGPNILCITCYKH